MGSCPNPACSLLLILALFATFSEAQLAPQAFPDQRVHVVIMNTLGVGPLTVHCKSKDDDLGAHTLGFTATWEFAFMPNVFGTTRYFCSFAWGRDFHSFDIFVYDRDYLKCHNCVWKINTNGPCRLKSNGEIDVCYNWH